MTNEEAKTYIEEVYDENSTWEFKEPFDLAIAALEKQIPKSAVKENSTFVPGGKCPCCKSTVSVFENYCSNCGQRLYWGVL